MARWSGPIQMQEVPDELLREDENGELRVTRRKPARKNADGDLGIAETARRPPASAVRVHALSGSLPASMGAWW